MNITLISRFKKNIVSTISSFICTENKLLANLLAVNRFPIANDRTRINSFETFMRPTYLALRFIATWPLRSF